MDATHDCFKFEELGGRADCRASLAERGRCQRQKQFRPGTNLMIIYDTIKEANIGKIDLRTHSISPRLKLTSQ